MTRFSFFMFDGLLSKLGGKSKLALLLLLAAPLSGCALEEKEFVWHRPNGDELILSYQLDLTANPPVAHALLTAFGNDLALERYFLNCIFVFDTVLIDLCSQDDLVAAMNQYPISLTNEMGIMNLLFTVKHKVWKPVPQRTADGKYLFPNAVT